MDIDESATIALNTVLILVSSALAKTSASKPHINHVAMSAPLFGCSALAVLLCSYCVRNMALTQSLITAAVVAPITTAAFYAFRWAWIRIQ